MKKSISHADIFGFSVGTPAYQAVARMSVEYHASKLGFDESKIAYQQFFEDGGQLRSAGNKP